MNELYHYGVKGMRWGHRKTILNEASNIARTSSSIADRSSKRRRRREADKMDISSMSNKDLQNAINRMNLEKQYKTLKAEQVARGRSSVSEVLAIAGDALAVGASAAGILVAIQTLKNG